MLVIGHSAYSLHIDAHYPHWILWALIGFLSSLFMLFSNFYIQAYFKGGKKSTKTASDSVKVAKVTKVDNPVREPSVDAKDSGLRKRI